MHDDRWRCANQHHNTTVNSQRTIVPSRRSEGGHYGSISQTHKASDDVQDEQQPRPTANDLREGSHFDRVHQNGH